MAKIQLSISYRAIPSVTFGNVVGMKKYLQQEFEIWKPFLDGMATTYKTKTISFGSYSPLQISVEHLGGVFQVLLDGLKVPETFNRLTGPENRANLLPPPSNSIEGKLILGLAENNELDNAVSAYFYVISKIYGLSRSSDDWFNNRIAEGKTLFLSALAADAMRVWQPHEKAISGELRNAKANADALGAEVIAAQKINDDHSANLEAFRQTLVETANSWWKRYRRIRRFLFSSERNRLKKNDELVQKLVKRSEDSQAEFRKMAIEFGQTTSATQAERQAQHDALLKLMQEQFRFKAPVKLWEDRADSHKRASHLAIGLFAVLAVITILVAVYVPIHFGDDIAASFHACGTGAAEGCTVGFSAKGPLTIGGLLLIMSVLMWAVRLQYRIFLSERHLSLDASEKMAFAQTYLALKSESQVDAGSEAIVLAALFRPTQDGIIKDDEGGLDFSAASILAKQFSKPN